MCSVRHRPMPSAPNSRARRASAGVSAFARTPSRRIASAHSSTCWKSAFAGGSMSGTSCVVIAPVEPSSAIGSPARATTSPVACRRTSPARTSISSALAPATHGRPMPRATSAACEALPPSLVMMPRAAWNPATSSASVNWRTRMQSIPAAADSTASCAVNTTAPFAAPGDAATPRASGSKSNAGSIVLCSSASSEPASIVSSASSCVSRPSVTASTAKRTAACAGRLALRVCRRNRRPSSIVNSTSCMSP